MNRFDQIEENAVSPVAVGSCLCGAVTFSAALPALWVAHCHCTRCQRAHGAPFVTWVGFQDFALDQWPTSNVFFSSHVPWALDAHLLPVEPDPV